MPHDMFQEMVSQHDAGRRRWYIVPLSFLVHTALLAILIVVPLIATDVIPMPASSLVYVEPPVPVALPPARSHRPAPRPLPSPSASTTVVPLESPEGVTPESGLAPLELAVDRPGIEGVIEAIGPTAPIAEPAPLAPSSSIAPVRPSSHLRPPARTVYVEPVYPEIARANGVEGVVIIEAVIGIDGKVRDARVLRSVALLDRAALAAVRQWEYTPTLLSGAPVPIVMTVTVRFNLD